MSLRILLFHQAFVVPEEAGGTRHYEIARHCVQAGHAFTVVASNHSYLTGMRIPGTRGLVCPQVCDGIRILRAYATPTLHRSFAGRLLSYLSFMGTSFLAGLRGGACDIVVGTSPPLFQAVSAWLQAVCRRRPFVMEVRDLWPDFAVGMGIVRSRVLIRVARWWERFLYHRADHVVVNSPGYTEHLRAHGVPDERITLIPNGVDPSMFDPAADGAAVRRAYGWGHKFLAVYAGALGQANDIDTILRAAQRLSGEPTVHVVFVGDGKERRNLEQTGRRLQLTNVTFVGAKPKARIAEFLAAADVCVATLLNIPMFKLTYPNKVFDYMAAGRPTILAIDGVIREVIEAAGGGVYVPPGRDDLLARTVLDLQGRPEDRRRMGWSARTYVESHFQRSRQAEDFAQVLMSVAAQRGRTRVEHA